MGSRAAAGALLRPSSWAEICAGASRERAHVSVQVVLVDRFVVGSPVVSPQRLVAGLPVIHLAVRGRGHHDRRACEPGGDRHDAHRRRRRAGARSQARAARACRPNRGPRAGRHGPGAHSARAGCTREAPARPVLHIDRRFPGSVKAGDEGSAGRRTDTAARPAAAPRLWR